MNLSKLLLTLALLIYLTTPIAYSGSIQSGILTEDFTDTSHWNPTLSTGLWNIVAHAAQAGRVVGGISNQTLSFGNGSDGVLSSATGYTFNTDLHPLGFNFSSVSITAGTISVTGAQPLIIRSLSTVNIVPTLSVRGGNGSSGVANGTTTGPAGGTPVASRCSGGKGGNAANTPTGDGGYGLLYDGSLDAATPGLGVSGASSVVATTAPDDFPTAPGTWDTGSNFRCSTGGAGGGGHINGGNHSTGGSGGAGGGTIRIIAAGNIGYTTLDASGGDGGAGVTDGFCSGSGAGGNGGAIWLQTLQTALGTTLNVTTGNGPANPCASAAGAGLDGFSRVDDSSVTTNVAASQTYTVQSLPYDLGTQNAGFTSPPTIQSTLNGGTATVTYSGSSDGVTYTTPTSDITTLSNQNIRYIKFGISIGTASTAGPSPQISSISIPFSEFNFRMAGGCGTIQKEHQRTGLLFGLTSTLAWLLVWSFGYLSLPYYSSSRLLRSPNPICSRDD